ncbi:MAG: hypothetical protein U5K69_06520 [Balneolaceae bacterium]|nr:hypothetical protein [Balneolaceae bacterium]
MIVQDSIAQESIDRYELVNRHNVKISTIDTLASLSVGNGSFAYTVDATGLQTFPQEYENGIPLGTQSEWGWHSFPNTGNYTMEDVAEIFTTRKGKKVPYATQHDSGRKAEATHWLRTNPHRLHLGLVGLLLQKENGEEATPSDIDNIQQILNLWTGKIESRFTFDGQPVHVVLYGHQERDQISVRIESPLVSSEQLKLRMRFPYGSDCHVCPGYDWNSPGEHSTEMTSLARNAATLQRTLDTTQYFVDFSWEGEASVMNPDKHEFVLAPEGDSNTLTFSVLFSDQSTNESPTSFKATRQSSIEHLKEFWSTGGAIDFSGSTDPRAKELERRVVLSSISY